MHAISRRSERCNAWGAKLSGNREVMFESGEGNEELWFRYTQAAHYQ